MQTIGERLEEARKKKGISIREAAEATKIRGDYLQKFENNQFDIGLTEIYTRGFLRTYANYLKLPADRIVNDYAALGRGESRPRQPSREVYGRMDISVASANEPSERAAPPEAAAGENQTARTAANQPRYPRGGSTLPSGPDPAVIFRYAKIAGIVILAILVVFLVKAIINTFTDSTPAPRTSSTPAQTSSSAAVPSGPTYSLVALDTVYVRVAERRADGSDGNDIFKGTLTRGQTEVISWTGPQNVWATQGENLELEFSGRRYKMNFRGNGNGFVPDPPRSR